jgi:hypothetical protein
MKQLALLLIAVGVVMICCSGCSTLNNYGIGGPPRLACADTKAAIDDRIAGSDDMHLSLVRRFADGDALCPREDVKAAAATQADRDQATQARRSSEGRLDH